MADKRQQETDKAIKDHLDANNPDAEVRERYWRNQYDELLKRTTHDQKERKHMNLITRLLCYTIYIVNSAWTTMQLCHNDPNEPWDSTQRLLWCLVLAMNVGFGVFVLMSRLVAKIEKKWVDYHYEATKAILELKSKLDVAEHNLECLKSEKSAKNGKSTSVKAKKSAKSTK